MHVLLGIAEGTLGSSWFAEGEDLYSREGVGIFPLSIRSWVSGSVSAALICWCLPPGWSVGLVAC